MRYLLLVAAVLCAVSGADAVFQKMKIAQVIAAERSQMVAHYGEVKEEKQAQLVAEAEASDAISVATANEAESAAPLGSIVVGACAVILGYFGYLALRDRYTPPEGRVNISTRRVWAKPKQLLRREDKNLRIAKRS